MTTPNNTLIWVTIKKASQIVKDQIDCMGCLSQCLFSNWSQEEGGTTGKKSRPKIFLYTKTLQKISHGLSNLENELMFAGHSVYRFAMDPFYKGGFVPRVKGASRAYNEGIVIFFFFINIKNMKKNNYVDIALNSLKNSPLKVTKQRVDIIKILFKEGNDHFTAEDVHKKIQKLGLNISLATVYNCLNQFTQHILLNQLKLLATKFILTPM